jgi:hypothetical protein
VVQLYSDLVIVLAREDVEVHLHALQTMTEQFQLCLEKLQRCSEITSDSWECAYYPTHPHTPLQ